MTIYWGIKQKTPQILRICDSPNSRFKGRANIVQTVGGPSGPSC